LPDARPLGIADAPRQQNERYRQASAATRKTTLAGAPALAHMPQPNTARRPVIGFDSRRLLWQWRARNPRLPRSDYPEI